MALPTHPGIIFLLVDAHMLLDAVLELPQPPSLPPHLRHLTLREVRDSARGALIEFAPEEFDG